MSGYEPGDLVELWEQGDLVSAVILGHDKGRLRAVTESGDIVRVTASRIAHRAGRADPGQASGAKAAASHAREARERAGTVDVAALWEILVDAGGRHAPADLASLALGGSDAYDTSAIIRCLSAEKVYFVRKGDDWVARSRSAVEETLRRIRTETERERRRNAFLDRLRRRLAAPGTGEDLEEADQVYLDKIIDLAVMGDESVTRKEAVALLSDLGAGGPIAWLAAFDLLVRLGIFTEDENLEIRRFGLRTRFPDDVLAEAEESSRAPVPERRRDLTGLTLLTVDDPDTSEVDDALSWEETEDGGGIAGVHISDPTAFVRPGGLVEAEAIARAATYYFPDRRLTMLPPVISEDAASLVENRDRPAVSFMIHLGPGADVRKFEIFPSTVRVSRRLSYEEADELLDLPGGGDTPAGRALAEIGGAA
ncbi:MAG TPA: RNB domain-containing ribonuclease, partial [Candidatus Saccharimonadales bacterium]|nr:RNB domain-containing ribonuclease [Candidatus Saccharimonadales bacterium]